MGRLDEIAESIPCLPRDNTEADSLWLLALVRKQEALIRRAAVFVNAVAVLAEDKTKALGWLADAASLDGEEKP